MKKNQNKTNPKPNENQSHQQPFIDKTAFKFKFFVRK